MGKVIPLERPVRRAAAHTSSHAPRLIDLALSEEESDLFAYRAGEIAQQRPFTEHDLDALTRLVLLARAHRALVSADDDLASGVRRREQELLDALGV